MTAIWPVSVGMIMYCCRVKQQFFFNHHYPRAVAGRLQLGCNIPTYKMR